MSQKVKRLTANLAEKLAVMWAFRKENPNISDHDLVTVFTESWGCTRNYTNKVRVQMYEVFADEFLEQKKNILTTQLGILFDRQAKLLKLADKNIVSEDDDGNVVVQNGWVENALLGVTNSIIKVINPEKIMLAIANAEEAIRVKYEIVPPPEPVEDVDGDN